MSFALALTKEAKFASRKPVDLASVQTLDTSRTLPAGSLHSARVADVRAIMARPAGFALFAR